MFENLSEITTEEISENGVCSAPDVLSGTPEENKKVFDKLCAEVVIPKINIIVKEGKELESLLGTTSKEATRLNHAIKTLEHSVGNVNSVDFDGRTLCEKINTALKHFGEVYSEILEKVKKIDDFDMEKIDGKLSALAGVVPEFVSSTDECVDENKIYVLPDGFIYRYSLRKVDKIINIAEYGDGIVLNNRLSSKGELKGWNGLFVTDYVDIELVSPYMITVSGIEINDIYETACHITCYNENKEWLGTAVMAKSGFNLMNGVYSIDLYDLIAEKHPKTKYVRLTFGVRNEMLFSEDEDIKALFIEFLPKRAEEYAYVVWNTNHPFIQTDYSERIAEMGEEISEIVEEIDVMYKMLENQTDSVGAYPSCWDEAVNETVLKIRDKQREFGIDGVSFAFFSDNHQRLGYAGQLIWDIMQKCNIPYAFFGGDAISNGYIETKELMEEQENKFANMMKCIPKSRFCRALGNHDGYYFLETGERYHCSWEEIYSMFLSPLAVEQNKTFGGDGTYYYVDDVSSKTRFIVLNSVWFEYQTNEDGTVKNNDNLGFGGEQLLWLCDALSSMENDYQAVFFSHSPVTNHGHSNLRDGYIAQGIVNAFISAGTYSGAYSQSLVAANNSNINVSFDKAGKVVGWFSGHIHKDSILNEENGRDEPNLFKTVTITSDANMSYDENEPERSMNGDTSHAIDFITANKKTGEVCIFRLGIGEDRMYNYMEV